MWDDFLQAVEPFWIYSVETTIAKIFASLILVAVAFAFIELIIENTLSFFGRLAIVGRLNNPNTPEIRRVRGVWVLLVLIVVILFLMGWVSGIQSDIKKIQSEFKTAIIEATDSDAPERTEAIYSEVENFSQRYRSEIPLPNGETKVIDDFPSAFIVGPGTKYFFREDVIIIEDTRQLRVLERIANGENYELEILADVFCGGHIVTEQPHKFSDFDQTSICSGSDFEKSYEYAFAKRALNKGYVTEADIDRALAKDIRNRSINFGNRNSGIDFTINFAAIQGTGITKKRREYEQLIGPAIFETGIVVGFLIAAVFVFIKIILMIIFGKLFYSEKKARGVANQHSV